MFRSLAFTAMLLATVAAPAFAATTASSYTRTTTTTAPTTTTTTYRQTAPAMSSNDSRDDVAVIPTLKLGVGPNDVFSGDDKGTAFRAELHSTFKFLNGTPIIDSVHPFIGADTTNKGGAYVYGGIASDFAVTPNWLITPSLAAGWYNQGGAKDLNTSFALRPGVEVAYRFDKGQKIGVELTDTTGVGSDDGNVGQAMLTYSLPFGYLGTF